MIHIPPLNDPPLSLPPAPAVICAVTSISSVSTVFQPRRKKPTNIRDGNENETDASKSKGTLKLVSIHILRHR